MLRRRSRATVLGTELCSIVCYELTFLPNRYFASGTGAAGLVGAFIWWEVRGFGVRVGVGLSAVRVP